MIFDFLTLYYEYDDFMSFMSISEFYDFMSLMGVYEFYDFMSFIVSYGICCVCGDLVYCVL